ncbi:MAG: 2-dehydro-3-deoxyglucarate aldolase [Piscinibacter sp.]|nr:2-dehydro-3-deoxyglucarate aldolase [Piscinibacter sp.]
MNSFRHLLKASGAHPPVGTWISSASPVVAEAVGHAGFDWGVLDMEHSPLDTLDVVHLLQALAGTKMVPVLRLPWNDPVTVKRVLDAGATTLMFPFIETAEEAARAVAATRYPPEGTRGLAGATRASRYGTQPNYFAQANRQIGVIVQLETVAAVRRLEQIAAVDGVDALFVGPGDLSASLGHIGQFTHPAVMDQLAKAAQRCRALGKPVGTIGDSPEVAAQYRAAGFDFIAIGSDLSLLMRAARSVIGALRTPDSEHVHSISSGTQGY